MADVDLTPTAEMARNAARGLELRREHGRGGTEVGVARARDISNGKDLSPETVRRMHAFFSRHAKNKAGGEDDAGYIAWMLWGGDEGRDWASRKVDALDRKERNAMSETRKAIMERLGMAATNDRPGAKAKMAANEVDLWNYLSKSDVVLARQNATDLATLKRYAQMALTKPDFTPPSRAQHGPSLHAMAKDTLADIRAWEESVQRHRNRMSRPGAKAKMGKAADALNYIKNSIASGKTVYVTAGHRITKVTPKAYAKWEASGKPLFKLSGDGALLMASGSSYVRLTMGDDMMLASITAMSRPGAKVRAALADACWEGYEAVGTKPQDGKTVPNCVPKATAAKDTMSAQQAVAMNVDRAEQAIARGDRDAARRHIKAAQEAMDDSVTAAGLRKRLEQLAQRYKMAKPAEDDLEREDVKAGLKLMAASDPAVSDKIRKLIKEGKPQDQAVAIALDMKRRGEL